MNGRAVALLAVLLARDGRASTHYEDVARASFWSATRARVAEVLESMRSASLSSSAQTGGATPGGAHTGAAQTSGAQSSGARTGAAAPSETLATSLPRASVPTPTTQAVGAPSADAESSQPRRGDAQSSAELAPTGSPATEPPRSATSAERQDPPQDADGVVPEAPAPVVQDPVPAPPPQEPPVAQGEPAVKDAPADPPPAEPDAPVGAIARELRALAAAHPARARLAPYGTSRGGEALVALAVGEGSDAEMRARPALLVVAGLEPLDEKASRGPAAAVELARALLERAERDPAYAAQFQRATLYVVAAADPDAREGRGGARACRIDRNFPSGWRAWQSADCPQGPYPLSEPETRALAKLALDRVQIAAVLELARFGEGDVIGERLREPTLLEPRLASGAPPGCAPPFELAADLLEREPGAFAAFARLRAGSSVVRFDVERCLEGGRAAAEIASRLLAEMPVLAVRVRATERLRDRLWLVRVHVENSGLVPTLGPEARAGRETSAWVGASSARISAASTKGANGAERDLAKRGERWFLGHLDGGERRELTLVLEGEPGARVVIEASSLRGGAGRAEVVLE